MVSSSSSARSCCHVSYGLVPRANLSVLGLFHRTELSFAAFYLQSCQTTLLIFAVRVTAGPLEMSPRLAVYLLVLLASLLMSYHWVYSATCQL